MESQVARYHRSIGEPLRIDPRTLEPVKCKVLEGFWHRGAAVKPGSVVTLARFDAEQMQRIGRAVIL